MTPQTPETPNLISHIGQPAWWRRHSRRIVWCGGALLLAIIWWLMNSSPVPVPAPAPPARGNPDNTRPVATTRADVTQAQDEVNQKEQRALQFRQQAEMAALLAHQNDPAGARQQQGQPGAGVPPGYIGRTLGAGNPQYANASNPAGYPAGYQTMQERPRDGGFLEASVTGANSATLPKPANNQQDIASLIDQQRQALMATMQGLPTLPAGYGSATPAAQPPTPAAQPPTPAAQPPTPDPAVHGPTLHAKEPQKETAEKLSEHDVPAGPRYRLSEGRLIPAVLLNRLDGNDAGPSKAAVTLDVWDNALEHKLIPRGAVLIGSVRAVSSQQDRRLAVLFHRIEFPEDVYSVAIDSQPGMDQVGELSLGGKVNTHMLRAIAWSLPLGLAAGASMASANLGANTNGLDMYRMGVSQNMSQSATRVLDKSTNLLPTITVKEGSRINVFLTQDLMLPAWQERNDK